MNAKEFLKNKGFAFETLGKSKADNISVTELMEEYAKIVNSSNVIRDVGGRFYSDEEIQNLKDECYDDGYEDGQYDNDR